MDLLTTNTDLPSGPVLFVHHVTGTYLQYNDFHDNVGNHVQNWAEDPFHDANTHRFNVVPYDDGTVALRSYPNGRDLTAAAKPTDDVTFQNSQDNLMQRWRLEPTDTNSDSYIIRSEVHRGYALAIKSHAQIDDKLVSLTRMWGGKAHFAQVWQVIPLPG